MTEIADAIEGLAEGEAEALALVLRRVEKGSASPVGVATPAFVGQLYVDQDLPCLWQATGATSADWERVSPEIVLAESGGNHAHSGDTVEAEVIRAHIPGGLMGLNDKLVLDFLASSEATGAVTFRAYLGPNDFVLGDAGVFQVGADTAVAAGKWQRCHVEVQNKGSLTDQGETPVLPMNTPYAVASALVASAVDTADDFDFVITAQCASSSGHANVTDVALTYVDPMKVHAGPILDPNPMKGH